MLAPARRSTTMRNLLIACLACFIAGIGAGYAIWGTSSGLRTRAWMNKHVLREGARPKSVEGVKSAAQKAVKEATKAGKANPPRALPKALAPKLSPKTEIRSGKIPLPGKTKAVRRPIQRSGRKPPIYIHYNPGLRPDSSK